MANFTCRDPRIEAEVCANLKRGHCNALNDTRKTPCPFYKPLSAWKQQEKQNLKRDIELWRTK